MSAKTEFWQEVDPIVVDMAKKGDMQAFENIYNLLGKDCYRLAYRISLNESMAQDIVQDCFVDLFSKIHQYAGRGSFAGWLKTMVTRKSLNKFIGVKNLQPIEEVQGNEIPPSDLFNCDWLANVYDVEKLLNYLPDKLRTILVLHEIEGLTHKEIAKQFNQSESFSKVNLMRAYQLLKQSISKSNMGTDNAFK